MRQFPRQAINTTLTDGQNAIPFPVILPPTDVFPLRRILITQDPPPGRRCSFFSGTCLVDRGSGCGNAAVGLASVRTLNLLNSPSIRRPSLQWGCIPLETRSRIKTVQNHGSVLSHAESSNCTGRKLFRNFIMMRPRLRASFASK